MRKPTIKRMLEKAGALQVQPRAGLVFTSPTLFEGSAHPEPHLLVKGPESRWCAWIQVAGKNYGMHMGRDPEGAVDGLLNDVSVDLSSYGLKETERNRVSLRAFLAVAVPSVRQRLAGAVYRPGFNPQQITKALVPAAHRFNNKLARLEIGGDEPARALLREMLCVVAEHSNLVKTLGLKPGDAASVFRELLTNLSSLDRPAFLREVAVGRLPNHGNVAFRALLPSLEATWSALGLRLGRRDTSAFIRMVRVAMKVADVKGIDPRRASRRRMG